MFRKILRAVGVWVLVFSVTIQSTGAASMAVMMGPPAMSAGGLHLPPLQKGLPPSALKSPAPRSDQGPSSLTALRHWGRDAVVLAASLAREINSEFWSFLSGADELLAPLEPVNLDLPAPRTTEASPAVLPAREEQAVVGREISPAPIAMATVLARNERPQLAAPARPVEIKPVNDKKNLRRFPRLNAAKSGWFKPFRLAKFLDRAPSQRVIPRLDGRWHQGKGIRFRVNYLNPLGFSRANEDGLQYSEPERFLQNPGEVIARVYWGTYAIYRHGQTVDYEIEIENTGRSALKNIDVMATQEVLSPKGGPGQALPRGGSGHFRVPSLSPGRGVKLRNKLKVTGDWQTQGSFEQTHLRITGVSAAQGKTKLLANDYQAGIIDPPPDD